MMMAGRCRRWITLAALHQRIDRLGLIARGLEAGLELEFPGHKLFRLND
jgi:hypothetical protein